jgi:hypothetical protein
MGECIVQAVHKHKHIEALVSVVKGAKRNLFGLAEIRKLNLFWL